MAGVQLSLEQEGEMKTVSKEDSSVISLHRCQSRHVYMPEPFTPFN